MAKYLFAFGLIYLLVYSGCVSRRSEADKERRYAAIETKVYQSHQVELLDSIALYHLIHERHGRVLLLNIWATWCQPCVEEFPDLIRLVKKNRHLEVVGVSVDYPDEINSKVIPFLAKLKVPFRVYVAQFHKQEDFITAVDTTWNGAVPATYIYDRRGTQRLSMIGGQTYSQFKKAVSLVN